MELENLIRCELHELYIYNRWQCVCSEPTQDLDEPTWPQ